MKSFLTQKTLLSATLGLSLLSLLSSCQDEDFGYAADQIAYETNFKKAFGTIPADKSWDLSASTNWEDPLVKYGAVETRAAAEATATNGKLTENTHFTKGTEYSYEVPSDLLSWLTKRLVEGNDNRYLGTSFMLKMPSNDFAIIPIYQGASAITSKLEMKVNGYDITEIWMKSEGMKATDNANGSLSDATQLGYFDGWADYNTYEASPYSCHAASTINAKHVWSTPIFIKSTAISSSNPYMYLSLNNIAKLKYSDGGVWDTNNEWTMVGDRLTSIHPDGYMLALNHNVSLSSLPQCNGVSASQTMIIGCEDANGTGSDHDVNDIVFLIVGYPNTPEIVPTSDVVKKRYMCEDLGGTHDFDFNDIVVDVTQTSIYQLESNPAMSSDSDWAKFFNSSRGGSESVEISGLQKTVFRREQTAKIAHVCGTLPIQAQVGNYLFPWITDPTDQDQTRADLRAGGWTYSNGSWVKDDSNAKTRAAKYDVLPDGWNPNEEKKITGWDPNTNNVTIYVQWPANWKNNPGHSLDINNVTANASNPYVSSTVINTVDFKDFTIKDLKAVTFPKDGAVPYIIATDQSVNWMKECCQIDMDWLRKVDHSKDHTNEGSVGSSAYYEYSSSTQKQEVVVWEGAFTGEPWSNALSFDESQTNGIREALGSSNTLNIYFDKSYSEANNKSEKRISLIKGNWGGRLTETQPDYYHVPLNSGTVTVNGTQYYRIQIKLTSEQINAIKQSGLMLQLANDNVCIKRVSFTQENGFDINLSMPSNGKVTTNAGVSRWRDPNGQEAGSDRVPFTHASFVSGTTVTLTAVPDEGYVFERWVGASVNSTNSDIQVTSTTSLTAVFTKPTFYAVGIVYQLASPYPSDVNNPSYQETDAAGKVTFTTEGTFYRKNDDGTYTAMSEKSVQMGKGERVYVIPNTKVTMTLPQNQNNYYLKEANSFNSDGVRECTVDHDEYTPWIKYWEKKDPNLKITSANPLVLDYATRSANITWSSNNSADLKYGKSGEYDYANEVNIWKNNDGTLHVSPHKDCEKTVTLWQEATDEYKYAEVKQTIKIANFRNPDYGYYIARGSNATEGDYQVFTYKNSDMKQCLPESFTKVKIFISRQSTGMSSWILSNGASSNEWYKLLYMNSNWLNNYTDDNESGAWVNQNYSFQVTMTKSQWEKTFGSNNFVIKSNGDFGFKVYISAE